MFVWTGFLSYKSCSLLKHEGGVSSVHEPTSTTRKNVAGFFSAAQIHFSAHYEFLSH